MTFSKVKFAFLLSVIAIISLICLSYIEITHWNLIYSSDPDISPHSLLRSIIIFILCFSILKLISLFGKPIRISDQKYHIIVAWIFISLSWLFLLIYIFTPDIFDLIEDEDGLIEWLSFFSLMAGATILFLSFAKSLKKSNPPIFTIAMLCGSFFLFIMAMEEISWGQRLFNIQTPDFFKNNTQEELNIHNFYTEIFDTIYYSIFILILILAPFLKIFYYRFLSHNFFRVFILNPYIIIIGSLPFAFHFNKWNFIYTQMCFFCCLSILVILFARKENNNRSLYFVAIFSLFIIQGLFLTSSEHNAILYKGVLAEYKEILSQLVLLIYSIDVYKKISVYQLASKSD